MLVPAVSVDRVDFMLKSPGLTIRNKLNGMRVLTGCSRCLRIILFMICEEAV